ncbi:hypothetical protein CU097_012236 [Rhizopus azygosporus]|uniref:PHD-type domain-containing protein n=1 Tax=Rhizopus azygosporus TaxID=86630 RepID=A0A367JXT4_RHIAZ|nr:hypothetical protein CU097_012236 [Rhizopus azygosporus]
MDGLQIRTIPVTLLARILLQLHTIPHDEQLDLLALIAAGLHKYGHTADLNGFLNHCQMASNNSKQRRWEYYEVRNERDWEMAIQKKSHQLTGLRFLLDSEAGKAGLFNSKCSYNYNGQFIPIDKLLQDTKDYFKETHNTPECVVLQQLLNLRLEQFERDMTEFEKESVSVDSAEYNLMGALLVRYDGTSWCLYLRDYIESPEGTSWRILGSDEEKRITCEQALADIQGTETTGALTQSEFSKDYRPVYLFYGNQDVLTMPLQDETEHDNQQTAPENNDQQITWEDFSFDEDYAYADSAQEENAICIHCGIEDIVNDVNDIFICESCENGVHQLCEDPPIQNYEKDIDPWYCRACCRAKNLPIPQMPPPPSAKRKREEEAVTYLNKTLKP